MQLEFRQANARSQAPQLALRKGVHALGVALSLALVAMPSMAWSQEAPDNPFGGLFGQLQNAVTGAPTASSPSDRPSLPPSDSQTSERPLTSSADEALSRRGTVSFRDAEWDEVILVLSEEWKVNIVAGSQITGKVSGAFENETLREILDSILLANGFQFRQVGNNLVLLPSGETETGRSNFVVEVVDVPQDNLSELDELIEALKTQMSSEGKLLPVKASGKLTIHDTPQRIAAVKELLRMLVGQTEQAYVSTQAPGAVQDATQLPSSNGTDWLPNASQPGTLELRPQYMSAIDMREALASVVGGDENLAIVEQENVIVIFGDAEAQRKARLLVQQLDRPRPQVRITGYIYDVDLGEVEKLGVDFNQQMMTQAVDANGVPRNLALGQGGLLVPNPPNNASTIVTGLAEDAAAATTGVAAGAAAGAAGAGAGATGGQFMFRTLSNQFELNALVQALQETKGSRLLADPHVTVVDRHTASLDIVTKIPVQALTQTQQGGNIGTTSFEEAGIKLQVTPRIASDGTIEMEVVPEFSTLTGFQNGNPVIDTRKATTVVRVMHGQPLVIGGLRSKTTVETVRGIPGLMDVKYLGALFRMHDTDVRESELLVFIMPEIVGYSGGLEREMHALEVERSQLSCIQTAVDGPFTPDCKDKHCPHHYPRARIHNGMIDNGLIGGHDPVFINPMPPAMYELYQPTGPIHYQPANTHKPLLNSYPVAKPESLPRPAASQPGPAASQPARVPQPTSQPVGRDAGEVSEAWLQDISSRQTRGIQRPSLSTIEPIPHTPPSVSAPVRATPVSTGGELPKDRSSRRVPARAAGYRRPSR